MRINKLMVFMLTAFGVAAVENAQAAVIYSDLAGWQSAVGAWTETATFPSISDGTNVTSITLDDGTTLDFGASRTKVSIGNGWATWSGGFTGAVFPDTAYSATSLSTTIAGADAFGVFVEPDSFGFYDITFTTSDGSSLTQSVNGQSGAAFFGYVGAEITSFVISGGDDFAIGDFYSAQTGGTVPEPTILALMGLGFASLGFSRRKSKAN